MSYAPSYWKIAALLFIGVVGISTAAIFVRLSTATTGLDSIGFSVFLAASRLTISSLIMIPLWKGISKVEIQRGAITYSLVAGICLACHYVTWFLSLSYTTIAASTTIVTSNPIWVCLFSWILFKEKSSRFTILGVAFALLGGLLIGYDGTLSEVQEKNQLLGYFLALISSWVYSIYFLAGYEAQRQGLSTAHYAVIVYGASALVLLPFPYFLKTGYIGYPLIVYFYLLLMAILSQVIGQTCLNWSLRWISPVIVTLAVMFEPIFSAILAYLFFREVPSLLVFIGGTILLFGVAIAAINSK
ncbi:EamA family transporter [Scytonema sp. UIC 10036]|uniref:DMT family transporter n=1 Tax=Scytonema sp. UIC 10036 TaxID=2304196 RepID=UPI0012DA1062|nr:DMT family transporter [Scytonema sp. UIC 10036]MUH00018.1 EamA family transporter [Scytonema sp. UIC 10036]